MPKSGGNLSETEESAIRRDSPLLMSQGTGLSQSLGIKQELLDQQHQPTQHHPSLPPELLPVSTFTLVTGSFVLLLFFIFVLFL